MASAAASVVSSLRQGVARLQTSHHATQASLGRAEGNLSSSMKKIEGLEGDMKRASERYVAMQKVWACQREGWRRALTTEPSRLHSHSGLPPFHTLSLPGAGLRR